MDCGPWGRKESGMTERLTLTLMVIDMVRSLDREDPLEKGMATHSSVLAWRIPQTEEPGGLQSMGLHRDEHACAIT